MNKSDMTAPLGISVPSIARWLDILEATAQIFLVPPYFENLGKRLIKSPKIYVADSGLALRVPHALSVHSGDAQCGNGLRRVAVGNRALYIPHIGIALQEILDLSDGECDTRVQHAQTTDWRRAGSSEDRSTHVVKLRNAGAVDVARSALPASQ